MRSVGSNSNIRTNDPTKVPAFPKVPASASPEMRRYLETLEQVTNIRLGRRGDPRDRAVTLRELIDSGLAQELRSNPFDPNRSGNVGFVQPGGRLPDLAVPPAPTGFQANGAYSQINLGWDYPAYSNHSHTEVHSHTSDSIGDATLLGIQSGRIFVDPVGSGATRYYWVRHVNTDSIAGPFNAAAGTAASTAPDVNHLLGVLTGAVTSSELATSLSTPIAKIDPLVTFTGYSSSYSGGSLITRLGAVENSAANGVSSAQFNSEVTTRASADTALSQSISTVSTTVAGNTSSISTQATSINGLSGQYTVKIDLNGAVAGYGLASTTTAAGNIVSEFVVNADRFAIMRGGSNTATATVPFVVQASATTLNGESVPAGVYMADAFIKNGSIANAKIGTLNADKITAGSIAAARIAANTIDASKLRLDNSTIASQNISGIPTVIIKDLGVGNAKIQNLAVSSAKIADLAATTAKIANLAVTTGKIQNLAVQTLKIADQAVIIPSSNFTGTSQSTTSSTTQIQTVSFTSSGAPLLFLVSYLATNENDETGFDNFNSLLKINGTQVHNVQHSKGRTERANVSFAFTLTSNSAGSKTVTLSVTNNSFDSVSNVNLSVLEVKK